MVYQSQITLLYLETEENWSNFSLSTFHFFLLEVCSIPGFLIFKQWGFFSWSGLQPFHYKSLCVMEAAQIETWVQRDQVPSAL